MIQAKVDGAMQAMAEWASRRLVEKWRFWVPFGLLTLAGITSYFVFDNLFGDIAAVAGPAIGLILGAAWDSESR